MLVPPIDPLQIINIMSKWDYRLDDLGGEEGYTFRKIKTGKYRIHIDNSKYEPRVRFTAAHEIGHIVLNHHKELDMSNLSEIEEDILDKEANVVAGIILMPKIHILQNKNYNIDELMNYFKVSKRAMKVRLDFLNLSIVLLDSYNIPSQNKRGDLNE